MREFTPEEKKVIKNLIEWFPNGSSIQLGEVLRKLYPIEYIKPSINNNEEYYKHTIEICYNKEEVSLSTILETINLFDLLVQQKYIITKELYTCNIIGEENDMLYQFEKDKNIVITPIINYYDYDLWKFLCNHFYITNSLIDFASDFKSIEQRRFDEQNCSTWIGIVTAIVIGIMSPILSKCISEKGEQEKIEQIVNAINKQKTVTIDSVKLFPNDTFNVNVIRPKVKITPKSQHSQLKQ